MASYSIAAGAVAAHDKTLVASTADTVTIADNCSRVEVLSNGSAALYFSVDGTTPTTSGANTYVLPAGSGPQALTVTPPNPASVTVKVISAGTPIYSVINAS